MQGLGIVYDDIYLRYDFGRGHPLNPNRLKLFFNLIKHYGLLDKIRWVRPTMASEDKLKLIHTQDYIEKVKRLSERGYGMLDFGDTPAFKGMFEVSSYIVGGTLNAVDLVMRGECSHAFNPGGGHHHAASDRGAGFCVFNDIAIAAKYLIEKWRVERIMIIDVDVHHGDGTQWSLYSEPKVLKVDFHESGMYLYPGSGFIDEMGEGEGYGLMVNIPLPPRTHDDAYLYAFKEIVPVLAEEFKPNVIIHQCGVDAHFQDPLAHLALTTRTYAEMAELMHDIAHKTAGGKYVMVGGGGYNVETVARAWTIMVSKVIDVELPNELPKEWINEFKSLMGYEPSKTLYDSSKPFISEGTWRSIMADVEQVVKEVKKRFPKFFKS
ncbi:MAG: acetoin utilization protein AcuC [Candidatus Nezhaarchaeota archaeon]|nr:acetoin utilization protein AcuC [Candidatus Nezhaarchaeota archaeon]MCX8141465.1 acetoin utilization protein AcuC [Candidatus Nezhaarchaeota archaeon]MDW8049731.1 acetoin utilization protein AcuC [Nitrososphaerota archaeon]